jgi:hypothetical protein
MEIGDCNGFQCGHLRQRRAPIIKISFETIHPYARTRPAKLLLGLLSQRSEIRGVPLPQAKAL